MRVTANATVQPFPRGLQFGFGNREFFLSLFCGAHAAGFLSREQRLAAAPPSSGVAVTITAPIDGSIQRVSATTGQATSVRLSLGS